VTPDAPDGSPEDEESALLRADYLMRRHQGPTGSLEDGVATAAEEEFIPTLTDLVRLGYRAPPAQPPLPPASLSPARVPLAPVTPEPTAEPAGRSAAAAVFPTPPAPMPERGLPDIFDPTLVPPADQAAPGIDFVLDEPLPAIPDPADDPLSLPTEPAPPLWVAPRMDAPPRMPVAPAASPAIAEAPATAEPEMEPPAAAPASTPASAPASTAETMVAPAQPDTASLPPPAAVPAPPLQPGHVRAILERRLRAELSELVDQALAEVSLELQARMGRILRETLDEADTDARADPDPGRASSPG